MKKNIAVEPGSTKKVKTGNWRTFMPVFDHSRCISCGTCSRVCPEGCVFGIGDQLLQGKLIYDTDLDYCKGCGICAEECPVKCIRMELENK